MTALRTYQTVRPSAGSQICSARLFCGELRLVFAQILRKMLDAAPIYTTSCGPLKQPDKQKISRWPREFVVAMLMIVVALPVFGARSLNAQTTVGKVLPTQSLPMPDWQKAAGGKKEFGVASVRASSPSMPTRGMEQLMQLDADYSQSPHSIQHYAAAEYNVMRPLRTWLWRQQETGECT